MNSPALAEVPSINGTCDLGNPFAVARVFVTERFTEKKYRALHHWNGDFYAFCGTHYRVVPPSQIRADVYDYLAAKWTPAGAPIRPTRSAVDNVVDAVRAVTFLGVPCSPAWLCDDKRLPSEFISCKNGLLHLPTRTLQPSRADYFTLNATDVSYTPNAGLPRLWDEFLHSIFDGDKEQIFALQEFFGLLVGTDTTRQKALLLVGDKRSGKGTIARILRATVGPANVCAPTLSSLGQPFGLATLIGKQLAILSDVRLSGRADTSAIAEAILRVSGEDAISIPRKFLPDWTGQLTTRFVLISNELPNLADSSGALASRFVILQTRRSFFGKEDPNLTQKLLTELPAIFCWALDGLTRLQKRGHFVQPCSTAAALAQLESLGSPMKAFISDRCTVEPGATVACAILFDAWRAWCEQQGREHAGNLQMFGRNLSAAVPGLRVTQQRDGTGARHRCYEGLREKLPGELE